MFRLAVALLVVATALVGASSALGAPRRDGRVVLAVPRQAEPGTSFAFEFRLPPNVAAADGRVFLDTSTAEVVGLAPVGGGTALEPVPIPGGYAFGVYGLGARNGRTTVRVVVASFADVKLSFRVIIDAVTNASGSRVALRETKAVGALKVGRASKAARAPGDAARLAPPRASQPLRPPVADGVTDAKDLDVVRAAWALSRANGDACATALYADADANGDGCVDIADVQAVHAQRSPSAAVAPATASVGDFAPELNALAEPGLTFVVNSTADTRDVANGDGLCADETGACTLRAAITESNWQAGENRIEFDLPGPAPVVIQMSTSSMFTIQDRTGGVFIDGYSQPGSAVNTATAGSNAVPGIELRGTGDSPRGFGFYVSSANNTIRGVLFTNQYRSVFIDGTDAHDNTLVGNLFGFTAGGAPQSYTGASNAVQINNGATDNRIGAPAPADRNVIGRMRKGIYLYGPGTAGNVIQNNVLCMTPSGTGAAPCYTGIDHDFGPKSNVTGGAGPGELNVVGPTFLQGIEYSHGWDPDGADTTDKWQVNSNSAIGNWVGFRADGSYDAAFRSGQNNPGDGDNGNGINVYDGSNLNLIEGNWIGSVYDGIQTMSSNATGNVIRANTIGESPLGEAAPLTRDGIVARLNTRSHLIEANTIRNVGRYGIGLNQKDVLWVRLSRNIITDISGTAIHLEPDPGDPTKGANNLQPAPLITSATTVEVKGTGEPGAVVEVFGASRAAGQSGLPFTYVGAALVAADGSWSVPAELAVDDRVTALQIAPSNNTSALGVNVAAVAEEPVDPPVAGFDWAQQDGTLEVAFTDTSTGSATSWSWDFGDGTGSSEQHPTHAYPAAGDYTVTLTAANSGGSDDETQTITVAAPPSVQYAADSFERTASNGWGSADIGGQYTVETTTSNYSVAGGVGVISLNKANVSRSARLDEVSQRDVDIRFRVSADKVLSGASLIVYAAARRIGNNEYRPRVIFNGNGSVSVSASIVAGGSESPLGAAVVVGGLSQAAGAFIWLRAEVVGNGTTTIRVKAWADGQQEPAGWHFIASNSNATLQAPGSLALRAYLGTGGSNAPLTVSLDDYSVTPVSVSTGYVSDAFVRTVSNGWGSADVGGLYTVENQLANYGVSGGVGTITVPTAGSARSARLDEVSQRDVDIRLRVTADKVLSGANAIVYAAARRIGNNEYRPRLILNGNGTVSVNASIVVNGTESALGPPVVVTGLTQAAGSFIWLRAEVVGDGTTTIRVKAWADGQPEPSDWHFTAANSNATLQSAGSLALRAYLGTGGSNAPLKLSFDDYTVTAAAP